MDTTLTNLADQIVSLSKKLMAKEQRYWDLTHPFYEDDKVDEGTINQAFNEWNWAVKDLKEKIDEFEEKKRELKAEADHEDARKIFENNDITPTEMDEERKQFTRFTLETSYGDKTIKELDTEDPDIEDCVHAFFTIMIGSTWQPITVLKAMKSFAESNLDCLLKHADE